MGTSKTLSKPAPPNALLMGPGMGRHPDTLAFMHQTAMTWHTLGRGPMVLDGDALIHPVPTFASRQMILTPHAGEFHRLFPHIPPPSAPNERLVATESAASQSGQVVVLKGHRTVVAANGHPSFVNSTGNPGLATAGTGDVLAGVIGGLAAQGVPAFLAASMGVYLHGLAADLAMGSKGTLGLIASDVIEALPAACLKLERDLHG